MSSPLPIKSSRENAGIGRMPEENDGSLDVGWLLHSKKDQTRRSSITAPPRIETDKPPHTTSKAEPTPPQTPTSGPDTRLAPDTSGTSTINEKVTILSSKDANGQPEAPVPSHMHNATTVKVTAPAPDHALPTSQGPKHHLKRPHLLGRPSQQDENRSPSQVSPKANLAPKPPPRRASWISSLSSKFSSSGGASPTRSSSVDTSANFGSTGPPSPSVQFDNPFGAGQSGGDGKAEPKKEQKKEDKPTLGPIQPPRRPSVLVQAGKERDENPGFLQSAFRKFSSSGTGGFGKGAGSGQTPQRKVMNVDQNRDRVKIADFDPSKLKRVAFCVDVEVAGYASWHEVEEYEADHKEQKAPEIPVARRQSLSMLERQVQAAKNKKEKKDGKKDVKEAIHKDKAEGAALKNPEAAKARKEDKDLVVANGTNPAEPSNQLAASVIPSEPQNSTPTAPEAPLSEPQPIPGTRKKEKKKRSEAERKERKERKRKQAEANGQVPLELTGCNDDDDDSSPSPSPPGASTPDITLSPTTDPLRIYKRCAQLRETTVVAKVCDQISSPSSTLAESPGTVAVLDLSRTIMTLPELVTLGDWLAVVPVRKILLEDCQLTDEGVRVILSGLLACKTPEQARQNKKLPKRGSGRRGEEHIGVIEKVSLKGNSKVTKVGWKHIALFLHMSKSLRAIDLSGIPFPAESISGELSRTSTANTTSSKTTPLSQSSNGNIGLLFSRALAERFAGNTLEELIMSNCSLTTANIGSMVDASLKCKLRRLGLAENNITQEGLDHIVRYVESGVCEGLDLGDNDLHECMKPLSDGLIATENNFFALSLSGCNLDPSDLKVLLPSFVKLKNFRFVDLSNNKGLFSTQPNAVSVLRKYLPQMTSLKRIHLNNVGLSSEHAIALAEILPDCPSLAHLSILDNPPITELMNSKDGAAQEEACALFASLMTAVRVSHTIVAIDIEVPSAESNEVVKALASQVIAYTLKNMEHGALKELEGTVSTKGAPDKDAPEILLHIVGHMDGYQENHDADEPAPDDDYLMGGNAIVKALGVCLGTADDKSRAASRNISPSRTPSESGTTTPRMGAVGTKPASHKKPRDMSKQLLESARKIRMRLKPALIREDRAGNDLNYRRLQFLDSTLERMIQRFEDEYPECKPAAPPPVSTTLRSTNPDLDSLASSYADASILSASTETNGLSRTTSGEEAFDDADEPLALKLSRTPSNTSIAAKALSHEEGRMHRYGQSVRREIALANNTTTDDGSSSSTNTNATMTSDEARSEASRLRALEERISNMRGEEIAQFHEKCICDGVERALTDLGVTAQELLDMERSDPEAFERFRESQVAARINAGV